MPALGAINGISIDFPLDTLAPSILDFTSAPSTLGLLGGPTHATARACVSTAGSRSHAIMRAPDPR